MTALEAIRMMQIQKPCVGCQDYKKPLMHAYDMAINALAKQHPQKILNYNKISAAGNCPACMKFIDSCDEYCRYCGQALKEDE